MIGVVMMALGASVVAALLGRLLLIDVPVRSVAMPQTVPPLPRKNAMAGRATPATAQPAVTPRAPQRIALRVPKLSLRLPRIALPKMRTAASTGAFDVSVAETTTRPTGTDRRVRLRLPKIAIPKLRLRSRAGAAHEPGDILITQPPSVTSNATQPEISTVTPVASQTAVPAWLADLPEAPPVDRRVWLFWLRASAYAGTQRDDFLRLVEESDQELAAVVSLARQASRPLVVRSLEDAQRWMQQNGAQRTSAA